MSGRLRKYLLPGDRVLYFFSILVGTAPLLLAVAANWICKIRFDSKYLSWFSINISKVALSSHNNSSVMRD